MSKFKFDSEKFSRNDIFIIKNTNEINSVIEAIAKNNKTAVIIRSRDFIKPRGDILKIVNSQYGMSEIDFRYYFLKMREKINNKPILEEIQKIFVECVNKGLNFVLNFDDCAVKYEELFDPDIKEFYSRGSFSPVMFSPREFASPKFFQEHFKEKNIVFDKHFKFLIYSKFVLDLTLSDVELVHALEKRFDKALPIRKICFVVLSK